MNVNTTPLLIKFSLLGGLLASITSVAQGDVLVSLGDTPTTTWSSVPTLGTANANTDGFVSIGGNELEQTITIGSSAITLDKIEFSYGAPKMTADLSLYIWEMGGSEDPTQPGFVDNRINNLLSANSYSFDTTVAGISNGSILSFDLTDSDEITLSANTSYVISLKFNNRTNNASIGYTTAIDGLDASSAYVGGALFYNEGYIDGGNAGTDSAFAIYATIPEPTTTVLAVAGIAGVLVVMRRRSRKA
ncbi:hypothetical protein [Cerasicoccus arenae]|uniref:PEP-CTERM protein-sorting domain-containing protein n=1 Tax=Cerasicoccus arenae TaxID=424488 RepID=A0A8J3DI22_9BACT|nr:hypothetical protein [Cerasicoccus arenae]MBK1859264.1 hypothetical protein [Cerasicoccus arenae]GHC01632.1 hypothetical protein GCM10007047_17730 [Cerasicoccus arenae]